MSVRYVDPRGSFDRPSHRPARPRAKPINIQDGFLFESLKEGRIVVFVLVTGKQVRGRIKRFDRYAVLLDDGQQESLVYKHAISGIATSSG